MENKLFVGNIEWGTSEDDLKALFSEHGDVEEVVIIKDKFSGRSKGFGFVTFVNEADAQKAVEALNEHELNGRKLVVNVARPPKHEG
jgi:RNA recognition motif-containing protein